MTDLAELLQETLVRLEAGEPLEYLLTGLPEAEAGLLKLAATLRTLPEAGLAPHIAAAQRRNLLRTAEEKTTMTNRASARPRWLMPAAFLGGAAVLGLACVVLIAAVAGFTWLRRANPGPAPVAEAPNPQMAVLNDAQGLVEAQSADGNWAAARTGDRLQAGQRVRTGSLSSVTLTFYDGSQARLGPNGEVSLDALDARKSGARVVRLTQWLGDTTHDVAKSSDPDSHYEVATPSGTGAAKGTQFHVLVTTSLFVRFDVDEGAVAVTNLNVTVVVVAGQSTLITSNQPPSEPVFRISGEGEVQKTGTTWIIAGRNFLTNANTVVLGSPQVDDWVSVQGRLLADGTRVADLIVLVRRAVQNTFSFSGAVGSMADAEWVIAGRSVRVDTATEIGAGIAVGDRVEVSGLVAGDGALQAARIRLLDEPGLPFKFTGVVETMADDAWTVSGISVALDANTQLSEGLAAGNVVDVKGLIQDDGGWLAASIQPSDESEAEFKFTGVVQSLDPWTVSGTGFDTNDDTEIDEGVGVGDRVEVKGRTQADGTWLAQEIEKLGDEDSARQAFKFVGRVESLDPWVVSGVPLAVDADTEIKGDLAVGEMVKVKGWLLEDGTWLASEIKHTGRHLGQLGCLNISSAVRRREGTQIVLVNWQTLDLSDNIEIEGDLQPASVVIYQVCIDADGNGTVLYIIVLYQLDAAPAMNASPSDSSDCEDGPDHDQGKGNDCHHKDKDDDDD